MAEPVCSRLRITVVWSPQARVVHACELLLVPGSRLADAIAAAREPLRLPEQPVAGVWGRKQAMNHRLRDGDRVEVYRELGVDPKVARRERFSRQGARSAGLFARRRPGAKAGY